MFSGSLYLDVMFIKVSLGISLSARIAAICMIASAVSAAPCKIKGYFLKNHDMSILSFYAWDFLGIYKANLHDFSS